MTNTEQLFIRACKSLQPEVRVKSVYRRFYGNYPDDVYIRNIPLVLLNIIENNNIMTVRQLVDDLLPDNNWRYEHKKDDNYMILLRKVFISRIRLSEVSKLPGFKKPLRFK